MKIVDITNYLESLAPLSSQESYDNCGLIVGDENENVNGVLISLDCIESTVDEAIAKKCELIIAHHPILFKGIKKITGQNYVERTLLKAIKNDIAIYAIHTNLDNYRCGVNYEIGTRLGLENLQILSPKKEVINKISCYVPNDHKEKVLNAMFDAGAGHVGNYSNVSFSLNGDGTFLPNKEASPFEGENGELSKVEEAKIEVVCSSHCVSQVISSMINAHPYEEVAHDIYSVLNKNNFEGSGMVGELKNSEAALSFLKRVKSTFNCGVVRHTDLLNKEIKKVAFCGGAGSFLLDAAKSVSADVFITSDFKYHEFFDADGDIVIADMGHFESEQFTSSRIEQLLKEKFSTFAVHLTEINTNPVNYL